MGYTFYPKDWQTSDKVFQLSLAERAIYRELIDLSYMNDNKIHQEIEIWARKWNAKPKEIKQGISKLLQVGLITIEGEEIAVPSSEPRLALIRAGRKGGEISKPTPKRDAKPTQKPEPNQRENKIKEKRKERETQSDGATAPDIHSFILFFDENGYTKEHAEKAFHYYADNEWKDSRGNDVTNWRQKVRGVWFKDEGRKPQKINKDEFIAAHFAQLAALSAQYPDESDDD